MLINLSPTHPLLLPTTCADNYYLSVRMERCCHFAPARVGCAPTRRVIGTPAKGVTYLPASAGGATHRGTVRLGFARQYTYTPMYLIQRLYISAESLFS